MICRAVQNVLFQGLGRNSVSLDKTAAADDVLAVASHKMYPGLAPRYMTMPMTVT